jgi:hypothetical protein
VIGHNRHHGEAAKAIKLRNATARGCNIGCGIDTHFLTVGRCRADRSVVPFESLQTCPHCRALVQSSICSICGKTSFEEVAAKADPGQAPKWWQKLENNELQKVGGVTAALLLIAIVVGYALTRPEAETVATELPPPASTSTTTTLPRIADDVRAPSVAGGLRPIDGLVTPGASREVGDTLRPWETPPAINFITALLLDEELDFTADIARVHALYATFPPAFSLAALDPPEILTLSGVVDALQVEETQPFAARTIVGAVDGQELGEIWLVASAGTDAGDDYLAAARARWDIDTATEQFAPEVGVRLWLLGSNVDVNLWATDLESGSIIVIQAPTNVAPLTLTNALQAWRRRLPE